MRSTSWAGIVARGWAVADPAGSVPHRPRGPRRFRPSPRRACHAPSRTRPRGGGDPALVRVAAGLLFPMPGTPMVTYGDEVGMPGRFGEDGRRPMPWPAGDGTHGDGWDEGLLTAYGELVALRRGSVALLRGGLRWVYAAADALVYLREAQGEAALVHVARRGHGPVSIDVSDLPGIADSRVVKGGGGALEAFTLRLTAAGPTVGIRIWQTPKSGARHNGQSAAVSYTHLTLPTSDIA